MMKDSLTSWPGCGAFGPKGVHFILNIFIVLKCTPSEMAASLEYLTPVQYREMYAPEKD